MRAIPELNIRPAARSPTWGYPAGYPRPVGPSIGFVRSYLSIGSLIVIGILLAGGVNELLGLGWWERGYPVSGGGFGEFLLAWGTLLAVLLGLNLLLAGIEQPRSRR